MDLNNINIEERLRLTGINYCRMQENLATSKRGGGSVQARKNNQYNSHSDMYYTSTPLVSQREQDVLEWGQSGRDFWLGKSCFEECLPQLNVCTSE